MEQVRVNNVREITVDDIAVTVGVAETYLVVGRSPASVVDGFAFGKALVKHLHPGGVIANRVSQTGIAVFVAEVFGNAVLCSHCG